jgi:hypothetical protein
LFVQHWNMWLLSVGPSDKLLTYRDDPIHASGLQQTQQHCPGTRPNDIERFGTHWPRSQRLSEGSSQRLSPHRTSISFIIIPCNRDVADLDHLFRVSIATRWFKSARLGSRLASTGLSALPVGVSPALGVARVAFVTGYLGTSVQHGTTRAWRHFDRDSFVIWPIFRYLFERRAGI